jgi:hypothetical protein
LVDFIEKKSSLKEPYILTSMFKCNLVQDKLEEEYIGLYTDGRKINDPIYSPISYKCCLSNCLKLKLRRIVKIFLREMMRAKGKEIAENLIRPRQGILLAVSWLGVSNC